MRGHNFYFTIDQGDDAVHAREFFDRGKLLTRGPETGIQGVYSGPGWYYFISVGYKIFNGDPYGALVMIVLLNVATTGFLMWWLNKRVSPVLALLVGVALQFFWPFYDSSRWAFSPFPLVASGIFLVVLLTEFWCSTSHEASRSKTKYFVLGLIPVIVALNAELAGAVALLLFYGVVGGIGVVRGRLKIKEFLLSACLLPGLGLVFAIRQFAQVFARTHTIPFTQGTNVGTFAGTSFVHMGQIFARNLSDSAIPQSTLLGVLGFLGVFGVFIWGPAFAKRWTRSDSGRVKEGRGGSYSRAFVFLTLGLFGVSYLFFASNRGFQDWHDVFLPTLLFISVILMLWSIPRKIGVGLMVVVLVSQAWLFKDRYIQYLHPSDDPGLLVNQTKVLDWIYTHAEENGFNEYTYVPTVEDDQYQYDFWWYGRGKYKYLPCEYSNFPKSIKYLYIPNSEAYIDPHLGCEYNVFLVIEPAFAKATPGKPDLAKWYEKATAGTIPLEQVQVGQVKVEKRRYPPRIR